MKNYIHFFYVVLCIFFVKIISDIKIIKLGLEMKYWKEKENNSVESMQFWQGTTITKLEENEIFLYGSNPVLSSC